MRLLYLPTYFAPEHAASSYLVMNRVEAFANAGFDVEMHVPTPTRGVTKEVRENYKRNKTKEMMFNNKVYVHRFPLYGVDKIQS